MFVSVSNFSKVESSSGLIEKFFILNYYAIAKNIGTESCGAQRSRSEIP